MNTKEKRLTERRALERFKLQLLSKITVCGKDKDLETIKLMTRDVSSGGAFLKTSEPMTVGTKVNVALIIDTERIKKLGGNPSLVCLTGTIIRAEEDGMAICFDEEFEISPLDNP